MRRGLFQTAFVKDDQFNEFLSNGIGTILSLMTQSYREHRRPERVRSSRRPIRTEQTIRWGRRVARHRLFYCVSLHWPADVWSVRNDPI